MSNDIFESFLKVDKIFDNRQEQIVWCSKNMVVDGGEVLEFGVWQATSLNWLAENIHHRTIFGFDSFEGLPERWVRSHDGKRFTEKGDFAISKLPEVKDNVKLIKGWFSETIPTWKESYKNNISLMHIDCDLYSSALTILESLNNRIIPGTIIIMDELCDWNKDGIYETWREGEWKALNDWIELYNREIIPLSRTDWLEGSIVVTS
jgi:hypothetical protein